MPGLRIRHFFILHLSQIKNKLFDYFPMKKNFLFLLFFISAISLSGQFHRDDDYEVREPDNDQWQKLIRFHQGADTAYVMDIKNHVVRFYHECYSDENYFDFQKRCPSWTSYFFGPHNFLEIYTYVNGKRNGYYKRADSLTIMEGRMDDYDHVGIWKYTDNISGEVINRYHLFGGMKKEDGLSIFYHLFLLPFFLLIILFTGIYVSRKKHYSKFYFSLCILFFFLFLCSVSMRMGEQEQVSLQLHDIQILFFYLWIILSATVGILSVYNLFRTEKNVALKITSIIMISFYGLVGLFIFILAHILPGKIGG